MRGRARPRAGPGPAVEVSVVEGVAWLTLARPERQNRLDAEMMAALGEAADAVEDAPEVRVVVLGARGPVFSAGLPPRLAWPEPSWPDGVGAVARLGKPVVAAVSGAARGWGLALALACDLRIATRAASFALPDLAEGRLPGGGATQRLPRLVGTGRALAMVLLGTRLAAAEAARVGLVHAVVPAARLEARVRRAAAQLAARGPLALRAGKEAVLRALDLPLDEGIRLEQDLYVLLQSTRDRAEGLRAFLERRAPRFSGR